MRVRGVAWPLVAVLVAGALVLVAAWLWPAGGTDRTGAGGEWPHTVVYRATADGPYAEVQWTSDLDHGTITARSSVPVPWVSDQVQTRRSGFVARSEVQSSGPGAARCWIEIDGQIVADDTASEGRPAVCTYTFTAP